MNTLRIYQGGYRAGRNIAALQAAGFDFGLRPTWRLLSRQLATFHGAAANRRAERLVMRFMDRGWPEAAIEQLLTRLIERDATPRAERGRHDCKPGPGQRVGSAGECPAPTYAETPAGQEPVCLVEAAPGNGVSDSPVGLSNCPREGVL